MAPVTTGQIYWGAVPFVLIQVIMVGLVIAFPQMVMVYKRRADGRPSKIEIDIQPTSLDGNRQRTARQRARQRASRTRTSGEAAQEANRRTPAAPGARRAKPAKCEAAAEQSPRPQGA